MTKEVFYFGYKTRGHHLYHENAQMRIVDCLNVRGFPWDDIIDAGLLEAWNVADRPDGRVHWIQDEKSLWYAFCWWDRSGDTRPNSNSGFYVKGFNKGERTPAFIHACSKFPEIVSRQKFNLKLQNMEARYFQR